MTQRNDGKVTLSLGNWLTIVGMLVGWTVGIAFFLIAQENRLTRLEANSENTVRQLDKIIDKMERIGVKP